MRYFREGAADGLQHLEEAVIFQLALVQVVKEIVTQPQVQREPRSDFVVVLRKPRQVVHAVRPEIRSGLGLQREGANNSRRLKSLGILAVGVVHNHVGIVEEGQRSRGQYLAAVGIRHPPYISAKFESMLANLCGEDILELDVLLVIVIPSAAAEIFGNERWEGEVPDQALLEGEIKDRTLTADGIRNAVDVFVVLLVVEILQVKLIHLGGRNQPGFPQRIIRRGEMVDV